MLQYLVFIGAAINFIGTVVYIKETIKGNIKPNRVSWLLWSIAPFIATFVAIRTGTGWVALPIFISGLTPFLGFLASFVNKKAYWKLTTFDYLCGLFSLIALILWIITKNPFIAILFCLISDAFATIPTLKKTFQYPETEHGYTYIGGLISAMTGFTAIVTWNFVSCAFLIYLVLMDSTMVYLIYRKKFFKKNV